jgi:hypothetical protein
MKHGSDPSRRREDNGRYAIEQPCDACGKPIHGDYSTDDEVCAGTDCPGFFLCQRKSCWKKYENMDRATRTRFFFEQSKRGGYTIEFIEQRHKADDERRERRALNTEARLGEHK